MRLAEGEWYVELEMLENKNPRYLFPSEAEAWAFVESIGKADPQEMLRVGDGEAIRAGAVVKSRVAPWRPRPSATAPRVL